MAPGALLRGVVHDQYKAKKNNRQQKTSQRMYNSKEKEKQEIQQTSKSVHTRKENTPKYDMAMKGTAYETSYEIKRCNDNT